LKVESRLAVGIFDLTVFPT